MTKNVVGRREKKMWGTEFCNGSNIWLHQIKSSVFDYIQSEARWVYTKRKVCQRDDVALIKEKRWCETG